MLFVQEGWGAQALGCGYPSVIVCLPWSCWVWKQRSGSICLKFKSQLGWGAVAGMGDAFWRPGPQHSVLSLGPGNLLWPCSVSPCAFSHVARWWERCQDPGASTVAVWVCLRCSQGDVPALPPGSIPSCRACCQPSLFCGLWA